ncbi:Predicted esterase [Variovorax sp. PDC80]|uniref:alpha/beta hydrolase n=1 Tax=Variovorax TaxID=34072 RepID=UPI0008F40701|nr:esterase [Variovorax sp. PDC80]QRF61264.1 esterase [Variovorax paradoxus]SFO90600.1 Predicted esterase [Variovorax sp. PDC80]
MIDPTLFGGALTGRMAFRPGAAPLYEPLPPGRHDLGFDEGRDAVLVVPEGLPADAPLPLLVMFHGAGGEANRVLPHFVAHARSRGFLLLAPQSMYATWDIVVGGHGPDLERLDNALATVSRHFRLDPARLALAGFSDGGSYALSLGLTNGDVASHVIGLSAGFMNSFAQAGTPRFFLAHGRSDSQLPIETSAHPHARRLLESGHDLTLQPFDGDHVIVPWVVGRAVAFFLGDEAAKPA